VTVSTSTPWARARAQGVEVETVTAEAEAMPLPDGAFDAVVSCLGVVFAADPEAAAAEMRRVARSTGVLGVLAWCPAEPGDPFAAPIRDAVPPPPPGRPLPTDWGVPENVERLLGRRRAVRLRPGRHEWRLADVEEAVRLLDDSPLHVSVTGSLDPAGRERFRSVAREAFTALAPGGRPVVRTPYLVAVAVPPRGPSPVPRERESHGRPEAPDVPEQHPSSPLPLAGGADGPRHDHRRRP
jgi:SAM-dependent methyltransferase